MAISEYEKIGENFCKVAMTFLPIKHCRIRLQSAMERISKVLYENFIASLSQSPIDYEKETTSNIEKEKDKEKEKEEEDDKGATNFRFGESQDAKVIESLLIQPNLEIIGEALMEEKNAEEEDSGNDISSTDSEANLQLILIKRDATQKKKVKKPKTKKAQRQKHQNSARHKQSEGNFLKEQRSIFLQPSTNQKIAAYSKKSDKYSHSKDSYSRENKKEVIASSSLFKLEGGEIKTEVSPLQIHRIITSKKDRIGVNSTIRKPQTLRFNSNNISLSNGSKCTHANKEALQKYNNAIGVELSLQGLRLRKTGINPFAEIARTQYEKTDANANIKKKRISKLKSAIYNESIPANTTALPDIRHPVISQHSGVYQNSNQDLRINNAASEKPTITHLIIAQSKYQLLNNISRQAKRKPLFTQDQMMKKSFNRDSRKGKKLIQEIVRIQGNTISVNTFDEGHPKDGKKVRKSIPINLQQTFC